MPFHCFDGTCFTFSGVGVVVGAYTSSRARTSLVRATVFIE